MTEKENIKMILEEGEGYFIEFKEYPNKIDKEMVAFANASGGRIYLGISDDGIIKGLKLTNKLKSEIQSVAENCDPSITIRIKEFTNYVIIYVNKGNRKPYRCASGFYIRNGATSQKMKTEDIVKFVHEEQVYLFDEIVDERATLRDINQEKYDRFLKKCNISNEYGYKNILTSLGLLKKVKNDYKITNAALLLFSTNPRLFFPQSVVTCVLFKGTEKLTILDRKDLEGDLIELIEDTILFLKKHLNLRYEIKELQRKEYLEIPETALRESVVNAIVHRDYFEKGANIMVEIFDNRVVISNPGGLVKGLDIEDFGVRSITRNPLIATTMLRANYIERLGTGIKRIENSLKAEGLPNCEFNLTKFFSITFYRNNTNIYDKRIIENDTNLDTNNIKNNTNIYEKMILEEIKSNPKISASHLTDNIEVMTVDRVKYYLRKLKKKGIIYRVGNSRTGHWVVK